MLRNDGNGESFVKETMAGKAYETRSVARGDFNGDGMPDLVVGNRWPGWDDQPNQLLLRKADGGFDAPIDLAGTEKMSTCGVAVGDVDGDGFDDLVFANGNGCSTGAEQEAYIMYGKGAAVFDTPVMLLDTKMDSTSVVVGDVTGDGKTDIIISSLYKGTKLLTYKGSRSDFDIVLLTPEEGSDKKNVNAMGLHDVDGDGDLDLVLACNYEKNVLLLNKPGEPGGFTAPIELPGPDGSSALAIGDVDGDGHPDVVFGGTYDNWVLWNKPDTRGRALLFANTPDPAPFGLPDGVAQKIPGNGWTTAIALGNVFGSGRLDVVLGHDLMGGQPELIPNTGNRGFGSVKKLDDRIDGYPYAIELV